MNNETDKQSQLLRQLEDSYGEMSRSRENLHITLNSIGDAVISTDSSGCINYMNPVAETLTGWTAEEARTRPLSEIYNIVDVLTRELSYNPVKQVLESGQVVGMSNHTQLITRNGSEYHIADSASPIRDQQGNINGVVLVFRDVSSEYAVRSALEESEDRYRSLFENADISIWNEDVSEVYQRLDKLRDQGVSDLRQYFRDKPQAAWDLAAMVKVVQVNKATLKLFGGASKEEFILQIDKTFGDDAIDVFISSLCAYWEGKRAFRTEVNFRALDGKEIIAIISYQIPEAAEGYKNIAVSILDITKRKQAERVIKEQNQRYEDILNSTAEAIFGVDLQGKCIFANPACVRMLGYQDDMQLVGQDIHLLIHSSRADAGICCSEECPMLLTLCSGAATHSDNEVLWRADGSSFLAEYWSHPIQRDDEVVGSVVNFLDITERRTTELALRRSQKMEAVGQLTGGIAHDFNNIVNIIMGNLELLKKQIPDDEKTQKRVNNINISAQRAADLTRQLLSFSRSQSEQLKKTNVSSVINEMESLISRSVTPQVEVEHLADPDLWFTEIDPGDLEDCLLNLILNARDAMFGGGRLIVETRNRTLDADYCVRNPSAEPGDYVELTISDNGRGISPDYLENIFEPFFTTKEPGKGTGLGLAMVYGFIQRSKGHIKVYSELGTGTTFRLYLPRSNSSAQVQTSRIEQAERLSGDNEKILVVDDEDALCELAAESLQELGYQVMTADNGIKALKILSEQADINLLFSDVIMPGGLNGYELAEQATINHPQLKVILASGYSESILTSSSQERFSANFLSKPYSMGELAQQVQTVLDEG